MFLIITLLTTIAAIIFSFKYVREFIRYFTLIMKLPGPKMYSILGNLPDVLSDEATLFKKVRKWSKEYYPVYKLSAALFISANICSPEDFEAMASTTKNIEKSAAYSFLDLWLGNGLLTSTGSKWQTRRKILTPAFHFSILQQFVGVFTTETDNLVKQLRKICHQPYINVVPYISQFTLGAINETSMGTKLNLENEEDRSYCEATHQIGKIITHRITRPWLYFNKIYYYFMVLGYKEKRLVKILHSFTNKVITERSKEFETFKVPISENDEEFNYSKRKKLAMLDLLLNAKISNESIDDKGIQDEVNTFMFEGHDTTSMALCFTLMVLANHKDVQELILQEINNVIPDSKARPTYNDLQELKFMERCIKECLRIYPSVPFIARVLEEDVKTSSGYTIPKGTMAQVHIFDIHRNQTIWPDPEKFDPDRFLPENCQDRHAFAYVPFSAGPRNCIGQRFALLELKVALCGILRNFELDPVDTPDNIVLVADIVLRAKNDVVRVKLTPRRNSSEAHHIVSGKKLTASKRLH
uniref:Cytochrome P450 n=1 Tax=Anoplophora glabripennis TaxID=217634 RepID=A0A8F8MZ00_ANOGL|nr:cytochrome P450 [Anoplophora glabripennis]